MVQFGSELLRADGPFAVVGTPRFERGSQRCRIEAFVKLGRSIRRHREAINETLTSGTTNALVESTNTKLRVIHRRAYGFRTPEAMIALGMLAPDLPGCSQPQAA